MALVYIQCTVKKRNGAGRIAFYGSANIPRFYQGWGAKVRDAGEPSEAGLTEMNCFRFTVR